MCQSTVDGASRDTAHGLVPNRYSTVRESKSPPCRFFVSACPRPKPEPPVPFEMMSTHWVVVSHGRVMKWGCASLGGPAYGVSSPFMRRPSLRALLPPNSLSALDDERRQRKPSRRRPQVITRMRSTRDVHQINDFMHDITQRNAERSRHAFR